MSDKNEKNSVADIFELLRVASDSNDADRGVDFSGKKPEPVPDEPAKPEGQPLKKHTKVTKRINAETAELIDKYSTYDGEMPLSDTQKLREKLASQAESETLLGYISDDARPNKSERVEKLYDMINDAKTLTISDLEKRPPEGIAEQRFTDEGYVAPVYTQEQMFPFGDTLPTGSDDNTLKSAGFDEDYANLTERVTGGELHFDGEEDDGQVRFVADEESLEVLGGDTLDDTEKKLRVAFDMMKDEDGSFEEMTRRSDEARKRGNDERRSEKKIVYTDRSQNAAVAAHYRKKARVAFIKLIIVTVLALGILFLELATKNSPIHSDFTRQGRYGMIYILVDLQLLFFIALTLLDSIRSGIKGIFTMRLNTSSLLVISVFFSAAYSLVLLFNDPQDVDLHLYNLPSAFAAFCSAFMAYLGARKDLRCFKTVASKRVKYSACELTGGTREADEFYKYLFDDSDIYTVKRANFIDGFVERTEKRPKFEDILNFLVPAVLLAGAALFTALMIMGKGVIRSYVAFSVLIAASIPASAFFMTSLPLIFANRAASKYQAAFIGNAVVEEYATASVLSFADTEVYPASLVKITNIRMYGDFRIDAVLTDLAKLFDYVGGPLAKVLSATLPGGISKPRSIRIIESASDGLCIAMDGANYFLGKRSYMRRYRFEAPVDDGDEAYENGVGSIMYVTVNEKLAAKLYIKYTVNPLFDSLLRDLYKAGLCLGVKTLDPNINNELINGAVKFRKCPISVLRGNSPQEVTGEAERVDSGIVCNSTLHNFLKMFALCDKTRHITKSNAIISIVSVFLSFAAVAFLAVTGDVGALTSLHALAFQLFWLLPVWLVSIFMI